VTRRRPIRFESLEGRALLAGGVFGAQGTVVTPFAGAEVDQANSLLVQSDSKLVAVGISGQSVSLARYESSGPLDPWFGSGGRVTTSFPSDSAYTDSATLEADQKILVVTALQNPMSGAVSSILAQYTTAGRLDPSFGVGGEVSVLAGMNGYGDYVAVLPSGEIVVAGSLFNPSTSSESFIVEEYQANGGLDTSFGTGGRVTTVIGSSGGVTGIAVQGNDIIVAGDTFDPTTSRVELVVTRYTAAGALDASFGTGGLATDATYGNGFTTGVAIAPDGSILILGTVFTPGPSWTTFVTRLTTNGALNGTYGSGGTATIAGVFGRAIAVQSDGKAVVAETAGFSEFTKAGAARFTAFGAPDSSFGSGGLLTTAITKSDTIYAVALQPTNQGTKVVIAGSGFNPATGNDFALARYTTTGALDATFGSGGSLTTNFVGPVGAQSNSIVSDGHGGLLVAGTTGSGGASLTVADYRRDGRLDTDFGDGGMVQVTFNPYIFGPRPNDGFVAVQKDGRILLVGTSIQPGSTNYDFAIARLLPDGALDPSFGDGGKVTTFSGAPFTDMAPSGGVVIQPDGKILVAGYTEDYGANPFVDKGVVVRYNQDGSLDTTFGTGGRETFDLSPGYDRVTAMAFEPNGEILLGGFVTNPTTFSENYFLEKLHADGTPDTTLAPFGQIVTGFSGSFYSGAPLLLRPDGTILVGGTTFDPITFQSYMTVAQFTAAGAVDSSFGNDGQASVSFPGNPNFTLVTLANMALQRKGEVTVVGTYYAFDPTTGVESVQFAAARFTAAGTVDTTIGNGGTVRTGVGGSFASAAAVLVRNDGTLVVVGTTLDTTALENDFALAAYNADGALIGVKKHRKD
jgi:uncharacterized delta-60 repeat protein